MNSVQPADRFATEVAKFDQMSHINDHGGGPTGMFVVAIAVVWFPSQENRALVVLYAIPRTALSSNAMMKKS